MEQVATKSKVVDSLELPKPSAPPPVAPASSGSIAYTVVSAPPVYTAVSSTPSLYSSFPGTAKEVYQQAQIYASKNQFVFASSNQTQNPVTILGKPRNIVQYGYLTPNGFIPSFNTIQLDSSSEYDTVKEYLAETKEYFNTADDPSISNRRKRLAKKPSSTERSKRKRKQPGVSLQQKSKKGGSSAKVSKYRGVSWDKSMEAWRTKINSVHLGYFDDEKEAARAYDEAALALRGSKATTLNFPDRDYSKLASEGNWMKYQTKRKIVSRGTSKYRGVLWDRISKSWRAKIKSGGKTKYLGVYADEEKAAHAYDKAAIELHGEKAHLNFPEEHPNLLNAVVNEADSHILSVRSKIGNTSLKSNRTKETKRARKRSESRMSPISKANGKSKKSQNLNSTLAEFQKSDLNAKQELWTLLHRIKRRAFQTQATRAVREKAFRQLSQLEVSRQKSNARNKSKRKSRRKNKTSSESTTSNEEDMQNFLDALEKLKSELSTSITSSSESKKK